MGLFLICPQCQAKVPLQAQICPHCGADLKNLSAEQRRYFLGRPEEVEAEAPEPEVGPELVSEVELPPVAPEPEAPAPAAPPIEPEEGKEVTAEAAPKVTVEVEKEPKKKKRTRKKKKAPESSSPAQD